jgi:CRP/FNR family transcriptional regulator, anaerobic regulatory protein
MTERGTAGPDLDALRARYRWCAVASDATLQRVLAESVLLRIAAGQPVFAEAARCTHFPLVLDGTIRVRKLSPQGKELLLYRVESGESCILTSSCLLGARDYTASAIAETDVRVLAMPRALFLELLDSVPAFRIEVFELFAARMTDLMSLVDAVAFQKLDQRLANRLLGHGSVIETSHLQLAQELGSVREIISRLLGEFAQRGALRLGRGRIEILDAALLRRIAAGEASATGHPPESP